MFPTAAFYRPIECPIKDKSGRCLLQNIAKINRLRKNSLQRDVSFRATSPHRVLYVTELKGCTAANGAPRRE
jgi:hypothetical protein